LSDKINSVTCPSCWDLYTRRTTTIYPLALASEIHTSQHIQSEHISYLVLAGQPWKEFCYLVFW